MPGSDPLARLGRVERVASLGRVEKYAAEKRHADEMYRLALLAAHEAGHGYAAIARVAGVSRQAVRQLIARSAR